MAGELVLAYGAPPLPFGSVDDLDEFGAWALYAGVDPLNLGAHEGKHLLLVAWPFDPAAEIEIPAPPLPFGDAGDGTLQEFTIAGSADPIWPAATFGMSTLPDDVPPNLPIDGRLDGAFNFTVDLFGGADPLTDGTAGFGALKLIDPDGHFDDLLALGWDNARIQLKRGDASQRLADWQVVAELTAAGILADANGKTIDIRDLGWKLTAELHGQRWTGQGGAGGDARLGGKVIPYAAGFVSNVTPEQESAAALIYRVSTGRIRAIPAVRDGGQPLLQGADYATYADLAAATAASAIPPATYATCLAEARFALGSSPVFDITCDVEGDDGTIDGQSFPRTRAQIARRIATRLGAVHLDEASQLDFAAFTAMELAQPADVGFYWSDPNGISKAAALTEVMRGIMGWWTVRPSGQFAVGFVDDPEAGSPELVLEYPAPGAGERRLMDPRLEVTLPPRRATFVGFAKNYTPQAPASLASGLSAEDIALYGAATRYAGTADQWTANSYPASPTVYVDGNYRFEADAQVECDRQQRIWSRARSLYSIPAVLDPHADVLGRRARIDNLNRLGFGAMKRLLIRGFDAPAGSIVTLKGWG
jgi:hypothetical protein